MPDWKPNTDEALDRQVAEATERARVADETEPRAIAARYDSPTRRIVVDLKNGTTFIFPADHAQGLKGATDEQLAGVEVTSGGYGLHWEALDADLAVPGLMMGLFGGEGWMRRLRTELGKQGGTARTDAKRAASRENGKKGGRPKKTAGR